MSKNITDSFIHYIYTIYNSEIPQTVFHQAKRCLLDYIGVTLAGSEMIKEKVERLLTDLSDSDKVATVIGLGRKSGLETACFINGLSSHYPELDDGVNSGIVHPGSPIISSLLPVAEKERVTAQQLLTGIIVGYEATIRLANAIQPAHKKKGFHATATCGTIGSALGIAAMLNFSIEGFKNTLSAAAISASGTLKALEDNSELKPFNAANAAKSGLSAAYMAKSGFCGPKNVLEGDYGFLSVMTDKFESNQLIPSIYDGFAINKVYVKPYAACRYCHPAIEASIRIRNKFNINLTNIKEVKIQTYELAVKNHDHTLIESVSSAKMSIPYSVAISLMEGKAGITEFTSNYIKNKTLSLLTDKVKVEASKELTDIFPQKCAAIVEIRDNKNEIYEERVDYPKGEPENPLTDQELEEKFFSLTSFANKPQTKSVEIIKQVWNLSDNLQNLVKLL